MLGEPKGLEPAEVEVPGRGRLLRATGDRAGGVIDEVIIIIGGWAVDGSRVRLDLLPPPLQSAWVLVVTIVVGGAEDDDGPVFDSELLDLSF